MAACTIWTLVRVHTSILPIHPLPPKIFLDPPLHPYDNSLSTGLLDKLLSHGCQYLCHIECHIFAIILLNASFSDNKLPLASVHFSILFPYL